MNQPKFRTRALRLATALAAVASGALAMDSAAAQECITAPAKAAISECPSGTLKASGAKKPQVSFNSAPAAVSLKKREGDAKPGESIGDLRHRRLPSPTVRPVRQVPLVRRW